MAQLSYTAQAELAYAGLVADVRPNTQVHAINGESVAIPFGVAIARGASANEARLPALATAEIVGVAVSTYWADNQRLVGTAGVDAGKGLTVIEEGAVWVFVDAAVNRGDKAYVRFVASGDGQRTQLGAFRANADTNTARRLKNARFETAAGSAGIALLVLNGPVDERDEVGPVVVDHAQATADTTIKLFKTPADRYFVIDGVDYVNPTGLAAHGTDFFNLKVQHGSTPVVAANWSTETGTQGTLTSNTMVAMVLASLASRVVPPGTEVHLLLDEDGSATLPPGRVAIKGYYI
jgi:hypothetical protein